MAKDDAGLSWVQVVAAAGAAVSSAVLLSTLGVGGTIVGAAVGSVAASIATHTYTRGLAASREQALALRRIGQARADLDRVVTHPDEDPEAGLEHADQVLGRAEAGLGRGRTQWWHVALVALALFLAAMVAITAFELLTGRAVSTYTGGSDKGTEATVPGVRDKPGRTPTPTPPTSPTPTPTSTVTVTQSPTPDPTPDPTPAPTPTETASPTAPTPTLSPTASPSEAPN